MLATSPMNARFDELETALGLLVPALERLYEGQVRQRDVIVQGDLRPLLAITAELDDVGARVTGLEARRQAIQDSLEAELGVHGLRELADRAGAEHRARLLVLLERLGAVVPRLQEQGRRNAELLGSAIDLARRTRVTLERLINVSAIYDPLKARRKAVAQRAAARLAAMAPSVPTPSTPPVPTHPVPTRSAPAAPSALEAP